jgi:hypothetical protein
LKARTQHCTPGCTSSKHSNTCRGRAWRARAKGARREDPAQNAPAYLSDELGLSEVDRVGVELVAKTQIRETPVKGQRYGRAIGSLGITPMSDLLLCIERRRRGLVDEQGFKRSDAKGTDFSGIPETARTLPLWRYREVEEAIAEAKREVADAPHRDPKDLSRSGVMT